MDPANKIANLGVISTISSFAAMLAQPIAGLISDRTRSRFGRRAQLMVGGTLIGGLALIAADEIGVGGGGFGLEALQESLLGFGLSGQASGEIDVLAIIHRGPDWGWARPTTPASAAYLVSFA